MKNRREISTNKSLGMLILFTVTPMIAGFIIGYITNGGNGISYQKPSIQPPAVVFLIVWSILYGCMGFASYKVWISPYMEEKNIALRLYVVQLLFNFSWSYIFFQLGLFLVAFVWILILLFLVVIMNYYFFKIDKIAGWCIVPYSAWLIFAMILNFLVIQIN